MAIINQVFNVIGSSISQYSKINRRVEEKLESGKIENRYTDKKSVTYESWKKSYDNLLEQRQDIVTGIVKRNTVAGISVLKFAYNYYVATSRFGQRGIDIQDQNRIQDRLVNKGLAVLATSVINPVAGLMALGGVVFDEIIRTDIQNKGYEYRRNIDIEQKNVAMERVGRQAFNSSRR